MEIIRSFLKQLNLFEQKHSLAHWLMATTIIAFLVVSFLSLPDKKFGDYPVFNSPDETANYLFTQLYAKNSKFIYDDIFAVASAGYILPRSMQVVFNRVTPSAFIGLPLIYGSLAKALGVNWIIFFTPIIMALSLLGLYWALWVNFDKKLAWLSIFLIAINPAWLYSAARPLMSTGLFISFVILALASFLLALKYQRSIFYALTGGFVGLALLVRISEIVWLLPLAMLLVYIYKKKVYWLGLLVSLICVLPSLALIGKYNYDHFASPLQFGYNQVMAEPTSAFVKTAILPFGLNLGRAWQHFYQYTFGLFPFWSLITVGALLFAIYTLYKKKQPSYWICAGLGLLIVLYLLIYYGSWTFFDNPDPNAITIGSSYVRYFMPVMLLSAPLIAFGLTRIKNSKAFWALTLVILCSLTFVSFRAVWWGKDEGVVTMKKTLTEYKQVRQSILQLTSESSIIIAGRMDKAVYPFRRVYSGVTPWNIVTKYLYPRVPAYLLSKPLSEMELNSRREEIKNFGLNLAAGIKLTDNFFLYQVIKEHEQIK